MALNVEALAAEVVLAIKSALGPIQASVGTLQAQVAGWEARWSDVGVLRERVAVLDAKAAIPAREVDLTPVLERLGAVEKRVQDDSLTKELGTLRERVVTVEERPSVPGPQGEPGVAGKDGIDGPQGRDGRDGLPGVPGGKGADGLHGTDGLHGKDGADGLGFDDLSVEFDGERTLALTFVKGEQRKSFPVTLPALIYKGVYQGGKSYVPGDTVTYGGHLWHCHEATITPPGDGSKLWQLCVRKGDQGKPGVNGSDLRPVPVVSVGGRS